MGRWIVAGRGHVCADRGLAGDDPRPPSRSPASSPSRCAQDGTCAPTGADGADGRARRRASGLLCRVRGSSTSGRRRPADRHRAARRRRRRPERAARARWGFGRRLRGRRQPGRRRRPRREHACSGSRPGLTGEVYDLPPSAGEPAAWASRSTRASRLAEPGLVQTGIRVRVPDAGLDSVTGATCPPPTALGSRPACTCNDMALTLWGTKNHHRTMTKPFVSLPTRCDVDADAKIAVTSLRRSDAHGVRTFRATACDQVPFTPSLAGRSGHHAGRRARRGVGQADHPDGRHRHRRRRAPPRPT